MICTKCGVRLMDTDKFCPKCGAKVIKEKRCSECGAELRDGTRFCHKCGSPVGDRESVRRVSQETLDIPIDAIEKNILSETAAEIRADRRNTSSKSASHSSSSKSTSYSSSSKSTSHSSSGKSVSARSTSSYSSPKQNAAPKKRASYREEEDWDDDDWDDDDWDDVDWDEEEDEGVDVITVMTAIVGCVLLVVIAVLGYHMFRQYMPKNYEAAAEDDREERNDVPGQEMGEERSEDDSGEAGTFTLTVIHNVNVRDNPSTSGTNVLKVANEGETYTSVGSVEGGEWYAILLEDGSTGYVFHEYVTVE